MKPLCWLSKIKIFQKNLLLPQMEIHNDWLGDTFFHRKILPYSSAKLFGKLTLLLFQMPNSKLFC